MKKIKIVLNHQKIDGDIKKGSQISSGTLPTTPVLLKFMEMVQRTFLRKIPTSKGMKFPGDVNAFLYQFDSYFQYKTLFNVNCE